MIKILMIFGTIMLCVNCTAQNSKIYLGKESPENLPEIFRFETESEHGYHSSLIFSPDLKEVFWSLNSQESITQKSKISEDKWTNPENVNFGLEKGIKELFFSPDGKRLYFLTFQASPYFEVARERIWFVEKENEAWGEPKPVDEVVTDHPTHWQFSVAENYNLYFTSEHRDVLGRQDIYMSEYSTSGYSSPVSLGSGINTEATEMTPFISPDESFLLFSRIGKNTKKSDIFLSLKINGKWEKAVPLGERINSESHDLCPVITPDGKNLFFISTRSGKSEIYWINANIINDLIISYKFNN